MTNGLEAAHIDNAGVIEAGVEPDERRNARGDLELRSGTLRNAGSLVASRALEAKASQALDNQGGSLKGATVRVDGGHLDNRGGKLLAEGELRVEASSLDNRQDGLLQSRDRAVVKTRGDLDNRGGQVAWRCDVQATVTDDLATAVVQLFASARHHPRRAGDIARSVVDQPRAQVEILAGDNATAAIIEPIRLQERTALADQLAARTVVQTSDLDVHVSLAGKETGTAIVQCGSLDLQFVQTDADLNGTYLTLFG